ncbi:hypothetical protein ACJQWK_04578 [Exserohilum turcicum]|uniref:Uncharacterized protein n=1 Tax=Exserohilum turcicum (strain 28A) TaxID=671987 RepID=R0K3S4_EXST2|nr:uncharacterized protein SETTUDRAFT_95336 [Exserohilum turcica Et28A]EOA83012.1 hypothetical protein SETTUDRAFT_95336 [Exserohilum turcica Et28A]
MDDWQDAAFSSRHMHNRTGRSAKSKHSSSAFDVRKTFASYSVKCPAWHKALGTNSDAPPHHLEASLELYRLTDSGEGIVGELLLPGVLCPAVILAGSRDALRRTIADMEPSAETTNNTNNTDQDDASSSEAEPESPAQTRFETFEKNSFRSPKFWLQWSGSPVSSHAPPSHHHAVAKEKLPAVQSDLGYLVFSGNDCRKFKGTLNCAALKWKNVPITGHKVVGRSEVDTQVRWGEEGVLL